MVLGTRQIALTSRAVVLLLLVLALSFLAAGCGPEGSADASAGKDGPIQRGGTVIVGMDQEPACLNSWLVCGGMSATAVVIAPMFDSLVEVGPDGKYFPRLAKEVPTPENGMVKVNADGTMEVDIEIREEAHWSDNKPITCDDMVFTWKTVMNPKLLIASKLGWDKIKDIQCVTPKKLHFVFAEVYAPYIGVVGTTPLPQHALDGKDFNQYWNRQLTVGSGPFIFDKWRPSVEIRLKRNANYWNKGADDKPYMDGISYRFIKDGNTLKIQLRTGEVDIINPPVDTNLIDELKSFPRATFQTQPGGFWENLAFQTEKPQLKDPNVRKAIAYAIDRQQITEVVLRGSTKPLDSTLLPANREYVPAWAKYKYDEDKVAAHLKKAGYAKNGEYWTKGGTVLEVRLKTTAGNPLRAKVAQLLQQRFKANGIKMTLGAEEPAVFFGSTTPTGNYDLGIWAWGSGPEPNQTSNFVCDQIPSKKNQFQGNNNYRYCNETVTRLMYEADKSVGIERTKRLQEAQRIMAEDMPVLPLYQRPETVAYSKQLHGVENNVLSGGRHMWNTYDWWLAK